MTKKKLGDITMIKVYVVFHINDNDGRDFHGVFSTKQKAGEFMDKLANMYSYHSVKYFEIEEIEIDEEL